MKYAEVLSASGVKFNSVSTFLVMHIFYLPKTLIVEASNCLSSRTKVFKNGSCGDSIVSRNTLKNVQTSEHKVFAHRYLHLQAPYTLSVWVSTNRQDYSYCNCKISNPSIPSWSHEVSLVFACRLKRNSRHNNWISLSNSISTCLAQFCQRHVHHIMTMYASLIRTHWWSNQRNESGFVSCWVQQDCQFKWIKRTELCEATDSCVSLALGRHPHQQSYWPN